VALNGGVGIDYLQFLRIGNDRHFVATDNGDLREDSAGRLPAFCAAADMIMSALRADLYLYGVALTMTGQCGTVEIGIPGLLHPAVHCGVNGHFIGHDCLRSYRFLA
jgi:hypothetical protein